MLKKVPAAKFWVVLNLKTEFSCGYLLDNGTVLAESFEDKFQDGKGNFSGNIQKFGTWKPSEFKYEERT